MAQKSMWSGLSFSDPDAQFLAKLGIEGLASGAVTLEESEKMAKAMGILPRQASSEPVLMIGQNPEPTSIIDMTARPEAMTQSISKAAGRKDMRGNVSREEKQETSVSKKLDVMKPFEQAMAEIAMAQGVDPVTGEVNLSHPYQEQKAGIDRLEGLLRMEADAAAKKSAIDFSPLAKLADYENARQGVQTNLAAGMKPEDDSKSVLALASEIQKRRGELQKSPLEYLKALKAGTEQTNASNSTLAKLSFALGQLGGANGMRGEQTDIRIKEKDLRDKIDKTMEPLETGYNQLLNAKEALDRNDYQATIGMLSVLAKNVGADSGALSNEDLTRWLPRTFEGDLSRAMAYLKSNPNVPVDPKLNEGLKELIKIASKNMVDRYTKSLDRKLGQYRNSKSYANVDVNDIAGPSLSMLEDLKAYGGYSKDKPGPLKDGGGSKKAAPAAPGGYDGSKPLPADASVEMKKARAEFLRKKAGK